ncbi:PE-PPE domain-containing protein [Gordonia desulfuricans]|uniref:PE-PPE domain-containing protein n=1 Tax=Gordonia desulfuricans TaxID=89051 RepID=A0A7K3LWN2_9ACTN|nr:MULTISPECIES: PE-PPE domain-containing protein [Gordonia]NDK91967.1 PE-PPE domain-containing protein [Gordonia desulfuricans]WLP91557.1 PE-PPE domain-containing protein [Gordonia sp. NB41Y]
MKHRTHTAKRHSSLFGKPGPGSPGCTEPGRSRSDRHASVRRRGVLAPAAVVAIGVVVIGVGAGVAAADPADPECAGPGRVFLVGGASEPGAGALIGVQQRYTALGPDNQPDPTSPYYGNPYTVEVVDYSASIWPLGSVGYNNAEREGSANLEQAVGEYVTQCGGDKQVVIAGYSQGARVAGDVLTGIGETGRVTLDDGTQVELVRDNVSGEVYSDPRMSGSLWGRGIELTLVGVIPGLTMSGPRSSADYGGLEVTTICVAGDPVCDLPDPLHDPIGDIDGLLGYFVKHGYYPWHMYQDPAAYADCTGPDPATPNVQVTTCTVEQPSSVAVLTQQLVDALGVDWTVPDLLAYRFRWPDIIGITLADFQTPIAWTMDWFPQLPELGYGGYLPDLSMLTDILNGLVTGDLALVRTGVSGLTGSAVSVVGMPVEFVTYWAGRIVDGITSVPFGPDTLFTDTLFTDSLLTAGVPAAASVTPQIAALTAGTEAGDGSVARGAGSADSDDPDTAQAGAAAMVTEPRAESQTEPAPQPQSAPDPDPGPAAGADPAPGSDATGSDATGSDATAEQTQNPDSATGSTEPSGSEGASPATMGTVDTQSDETEADETEAVEAG